MSSNAAGFTPKRMKVSIIPCLTGRRRSKIVPAVPAARVQNSEILVVDDRSEEGTRAVLKEKLRRTCDRIIHYPINHGKGAAFHSGFAAATGISSSFRMRTSNTARGLPRALGAVDIRSGGRGLLLPIHGRAAASGVLFLAHGCNRCLTLLSNMFGDLNIMDVQSGHRVFKASVIKSIYIEERGFR